MKALLQEVPSRRNRWVSIVMGIPQNGWFMMVYIGKSENKPNDLGVPLFQETLM
jgi:hypothetical protein